MKAQPTPLTVPQIQALSLLRDGWQCPLGERLSWQKGHFVWYCFRRRGATRTIASRTLVSLHDRGLITTAVTTSPQAGEGAEVAAYVLALTEQGRQALVQHTEHSGKDGSYVAS